jgi:hypothetical protein
LQVLPIDVPDPRHLVQGRGHHPGAGWAERGGKDLSRVPVRAVIDWPVAAFQIRAVWSLASVTTRVPSPNGWHFEGGGQKSVRMLRLEVLHSHHETTGQRRVVPGEKASITDKGVYKTIRLHEGEAETLGSSLVREAVRKLLGIED